MPYKLCMMLEIFLILVFLSSHVLAQGRKESWFIPTKLATNLSVSLTDSSSRKEVESLHSWCLLYDVYFVSNCVLYSLLSFSFFFLSVQGFVMVETNFRMYSYSSSKLHTEILRLFSRYV